MKKDLPENQEHDDEQEIFPDWSNIDATSIYRAGNEVKGPTKKNDLNQIVKETNSFFKISIVMLIIVFAIIFISSDY